jgi:hypothetical protein
MLKVVAAAVAVVVVVYGVSGDCVTSRWVRFATVTKE